MSEDLFESVRGVTKNEPLDLLAVSKGKVNFHIALTPKVVGSDKIKKNFAAAIDRHQQLKVHQDYLKKLIQLADLVETEVIRPINRLYSDSLAREIRLLDQWNDRPPHRLSTRRKEGLQSLLLKRLDDAILTHDRLDLEDLRTKHKPSLSPDEKAAATRAMADVIAEMTGLTIDPADLMGEMTPERQAMLDEKYGREFTQGSAGTAVPGATQPRIGGKPRSNRPLTKQQLKKEAEKQAAQDLLDQDLKRVFKNLVLELHPDREQDEVRRREKDELMKGLIQARDANDYSELLRLHVLVTDQRQGNNSDAKELFAESTLKTLTQLMREKSRQLENENFDLQNDHPLVRELSRVTGIAVIDQPQLQTTAQRIARRIKQSTVEIEQLLATLPGTASTFNRYLDDFAEDANAAFGTDLIEEILRNNFSKPRGNGFF